MRRKVPVRQVDSQRTQLTLPTGPAHSVDLHSMPPVLEPMLVGEDGEHALEAFVGEFHHHPATLTDEVFVVGLSRPGLKALEPFTELMSPDQATFDQEVEGAVHGGQAHLLAPLFELTPD